MILFVLAVTVLNIAYDRLYNKIYKLVDFLRLGPRVEMPDGEIIYLNGQPDQQKQSLSDVKIRKHLKDFTYLLAIFIILAGFLAIFVYIFGTIMVVLTI